MDNENRGLYSLDSVSELISDDLKSVFQFIEQQIIKVYPTTIIKVEHAVLSMMNQRECNIFKILTMNLSSFNFSQIATAYESQIAQSPMMIVKPGREPKLDGRLFKYVNDAVGIANEFFREEKANSEHLLLAMLNDSSPSNKEKVVFSRVGMTFNFVLDAINKQRNGGNSLPVQFVDNSMKIIPMDDGTGYEVIVPFNADGGEDISKKIDEIRKQSKMAIEKYEREQSQRGPKSMIKGGAVSQFCINVSKQAAEGKIDRMVGRENELDEVIRILGRRRKNNVIIVGSGGIGKTTIAENLAYRILDGNVPKFLKNKTVISLDMTALVAGTTLRGMFEERTKAIIDEIKENKNYILLIDNISSVLGHKNSNDYDISSMLSTALENGDLQVVGTSDFKSYRGTFDKDPSLSRRFQKMVIDAPTLNDSVEILNGVKGYYEDFHGVKFTDKAIISSVYLSDRYLTDRNLPDAAIDLIDEAGSLIGNNQPEDPRVIDLNRRLEYTRKNLNEARKAEHYDTVDAMEKVERDLIVEQSKLSKTISEERKKNRPVVDEDVILNLISKKTGVPSNSLSSSEKEKLMTMGDRLKSEVIGQDEAIDTIVRSLKRNRVGLHGGGCMFSMLAIAKTGVGKTLIAKKLAKEMFGNEENLIRFDMSEYPDKSAVNKLIGSNPGYIGYEDGGQLTEAIKNHKHCVLLLDEIEKADPEVYNIFLQVLDEGFLTDNSGMKVDFKNVIVIFTSNVGTRAASDFAKSIGFGDNDEKNSKRILEKELKKRFPPEFINRIDTVIYFNNLTDENLTDIIRLEMNKMVSNVKEIGYDAVYDDETVAHILSLAKEEKEYGARPIVRAIRTEVEDKITDKLLENDYEKGYMFRIVFNKEDETVEIR